MFKIATWNVNSLKIRLEQVIQWLETSQADLLAIQETKVSDDHFPLSAFTERGYQVAYSGQKTYNGVAVISKQPITEPLTDIPNLDDPQRRLLISTIAGIRVVNLYVPNGSEVSSDKYVYKLDWLKKVGEFIRQQLSLYSKVVVLGDFNIAPEDRDVYDPVAWQGSVLVSQEERKAFNQWLQMGLYDSFRKFEHDEKVYTWWDYRAAAFRRNMGLRIDHILLSEELITVCSECGIDKEQRKAERPSDHAPVWVSLNV